MPLNVLIAPDKFKGTLTAHAAADAIARGWRKARPNDRLTLLPMSDGGDGFGEVISALIQARRQTVKTVDAAHRPCKASWWWQTKTRTAIVESAKVIGLAMLPPEKFHPFQLDTFGLGAVLRTAVNKGAKRIIIGIGGSATNDGGFGLARALGWQFFSADGRQITRWTDIDSLAEIRFQQVGRCTPCAPFLAFQQAAGRGTARPTKFPFTKGVEVIVAVDVQNPLLGKRGATRVYGPQKGLRPHDFQRAEKCLRRLSQVVAFTEKSFRVPALAGPNRLKAGLQTIPGSGAAGGLGFGLMAFASAKPQNGFELFAELSKLSQQLRASDLVITGEGMIDRSSLMGKGAGEIARRCGKLKLPCIGLAGSTDHSPGLKRIFEQTYALTDLTSAKSARAKPSFWLERLAGRAASHTNRVALT